MEPADTIIRKLGGAKAVSEIAAVSPSALTRWRSSRANGGTDGWIPIRHHRTLLDYARRKGIPLSAEEFLPTVASNNNKKQRSAP